MANLSASLGGVNEAARIVEAPAQSSGLATALGALGNSFEAVNSAFNARAQNKRQAAADARADRAELRADEDQAWQREERARTRAGWVAEDYAANSLNGLNSAANGVVEQVEQPVVAPVPSFSEQLEGLPASASAFVNKAGDQLTRIQAGVSQGRMPAMALEGMANRLYNEGVNKGIPAGVLRKAFKDAGIDTFHAYDDTTAQQEAEDKSRGEEEDAAYKAGMLAVPMAGEEGLTRAQIIARGRQKLSDDELINVATKNAALTASRNAETRAATNDSREQNDNDATNVSLLTFDAAIDGVLDTTLRVTNGAFAPERGSDTTYELKLAKYRAGLPQYFEQVKAKVLNDMRAKGFSPSAVTNAQSSIDNRIKGILDGVDAGGKAYSEAATAITTSFGLRMREAAPLVYQMRSLGIDYASIPGLMDVMDEGTKTRFGSQMRAILSDGLVDSAEKTAFKNLVAVATGKANITDIDSAAGRRAIVQQAATYTNNQNAAIAQGRGDGQTYMAMGRQVAIGAASLTPQSSSTDLYRATTVNSGRGTIDAINKLRGNSETREEAELLGSAKRAASARLLQSSHQKLNAVLRNGTNRFQFLNFNTSSGQFEFRFNDGAWRRSGMSAPAGSGAPSYASGARSPVSQLKPEPSQEAKELLATLNGNLSFLTRTGEWDDDAPKGSQREVATFWATGRPTPDMQKKQAAGKGSSKGNVYQVLDAGIEALSRIPEIETAGDADIEGPEGTGRNPRSSAFGTGQFIESTWISTLKKHAPELIEGKSREDILAMRSNKELGRKAIGWYRSDNAAYLAGKGLPSGRTATALAHFAGPQGAEKLFKADPNASVESVLGQDAVNRNPHLRGKTASQTIEWAKGFYRA